MGKTRFHSFVVLAGMRTGSNFLEANLNAMGGVVCHGEAFNPGFLGKKGQMELFGVSLTAREADPLVLLQRMREKTDGISGFRFFHDHDPRVLEAVLRDEGCAKVVLTRNPLESYVSLQIAKQTGQWKLGDAKALKTAKVAFDARAFEVHLNQRNSFLALIRSRLQQTGQTAFELDYEDLQNLAVLNGLARYLGASEGLAAPDQALKKQNPGALADKVTNPSAMLAALAEVDRFGLLEEPSFEPKRSPGIPGYWAADGAALLYMPMRGGLDGLIRDWLARCGSGGVSGDFVQKSLRQWKRSRPGHQSFTVLRHPLARAYAAFSQKVLVGDAPELRGLLTRNYKLSLPDVGEDFADLDAHRAAFLGFLQFLKANLAGQTGFRVDARWASQTAVLQGFAQFQGPDHVLRETRLADDLGYLAGLVGIKAPAPPEIPATALDLIYDAQIEAASRAIYARDYLGFGFADWRKDAA